jgi:hypothetical protein|tara:strand:- start:4197 stop:5036 length:840 start_codon:yes stop_codon:yes gene_type:complete
VNNIVKEIHTSCRDCAFEISSGVTQTSCELGRIERYRDQGAEVIEVYDGSGKEFFVINDKICVYHRDKEWASNFAKSELKEIVEKQIKIPYQCILITSDKIHSELDSLELQVASLSKQHTPPSFLSIVVPSYSHVGGEETYNTNMAIEKMMLPYKEKFDWSVQSVIREDISTRSAIDLAIDSMYFKKKLMYYIVFEEGFCIPESFSKELHISIFEDDKKPAFARAVCGLNGLLVSRMLHRKHTGNAFDISIETKIEHLEEDSVNHIYEITELCQSLKPS